MSRRLNSTARIWRGSLKILYSPLFSLNSRRAALATCDIAYELARMFEMLRKSKGEEGLRVFRHLDEALDWVLAKNAAA